MSPARDLAWDGATGNGQTAHDLAPHFARIVATDASADQIANAAPHQRMVVAPAAQSPLKPPCADLMTVAQAVHGFDHDRFYAEVRRVLKPGGALAGWTYGLIQVMPSR